MPIHLHTVYERMPVVPAAAGSSVMAIGIFGSDALQEMAALREILTPPMVISLMALWLFLACSYALTWFKGGLGTYTRPPIGAFAIGSWVAASAVLARIIVLGMPDWHALALALGVLALTAWVWFLTVVAGHIGHVLSGLSSGPIPGVVLLPTVSTQSLALAALDLFPGASMSIVAGAVVVLGGMMYLAGTAAVLRSHFCTTSWTLADHWDNTNCILHGAGSITGLAVVAWQLGPPETAVVLWLYVLAAFLAVEAIEGVRLVVRIRKYGWFRGAFAYNVTQWSRNFTFGMFYAFTVALSHAPGFVAEPHWIRAIQGAIASYGQYLVLALLLVEICLFAGTCLENRISSARV